MIRWVPLGIVLGALGLLAIRSPGVSAAAQPQPRACSHRGSVHHQPILPRLPQRTHHPHRRGRLHRIRLAGLHDGQLGARSVLASGGPARNDGPSGGRPPPSRTSVPSATCRWPATRRMPAAASGPSSNTCRLVQASTPREPARGGRRVLRALSPDHRRRAGDRGQPHRQLPDRHRTARRRASRFRPLRDRGTTGSG